MSGTGRVALTISIICLLLHYLMGPTILANVLALFVGFFAALSAVFISVAANWNANPLTRSWGTTITAVVVLIWIITLVATDNVPAGYGP